MLLVEKLNIIPGIIPVNLASGANNGDWVSLRDYGRCAIVFVAGAGAAAQDPTITLLQAKTNSGGSSKALSAITRIDLKQGSALTAVSAFTAVTQAAANTYTNDTMSETQQVVVIDINADDLDADNGFHFIQASIADPGSTSKVGVLLYVLHEPRYASGGAPPSAIA